MTKTLPKATKTQIRHTNEALRGINATYHEGIPVGQIAQAVHAHELDAEELEGIYTGHHGRQTCQIAANAWLTFTWYRMEATGRYEIVAYVS